MERGQNVKTLNKNPSKNPTFFSELKTHTEKNFVKIEIECVLLLLFDLCVCNIKGHRSTLVSHTCSTR